MSAPAGVLASSGLSALASLGLGAPAALSASSRLTGSVVVSGWRCLPVGFGRTVGIAAVIAPERTFFGEVPG